MSAHGARRGFNNEGETAMMELVRYEAACRALAEARSVDEVKDIRDKAMAMKLYARQAKNRELEADAYELRVRAERKLGEMIGGQKETVGLATGGEHGGKARLDGTRAEPSNARPTLAEAGIDKKLSSRAQKMHAIPPAAFEEMVKDGRDEVQRAAEKRVIKEIKIAQARDTYDARAESGGKVEDLVALAASGKRFAVIYADPPWHMSTWSERGGLRAPQAHYGTMPIDEIAALPVRPLAADDAVLLLWTTWSDLPGALDVIKAWGFTYKTLGFLWVKRSRSGASLHTGMGRWTRSNSEICLLATNGNPLRLDMGVHQVIETEAAIEAPVMEHSRKPNEAHARIERLLAGPYIELFARAERSSWTTWGNELRSPMVALPAPKSKADEIRREWHLFQLFLVKTCGFHPVGASDHVNWVRGRPFDDVADWLGDDAWRKWQGDQPAIPEATKTAWRVWAVEREGMSLAVIDAELEAAHERLRRAA
jgi:N6-adenosine-specific RNA methylase IME4